MLNTRSRPEHEILFCIARRELDATQQLRIRRLLEEEIDWDYLLAAANTHGLIPLLHKHLHLLPAYLPGAHPASINFLSRLTRHSLANATSVLHLAGKQLKLYRLLKDHGITAAIFKGSVLAQMAYGEMSLRQAGDIDVLISRADFPQTKLLLESLGYQMTPQLTAAQLASHLASHCEIQFVRDDWFTVVDLHWALAPKNFVFKMETDELLSRLQPVTIAGTEVETFATEDLIVYLSMHGAKHLWRALEWISSLGELLRASESIAWDTVVARAEKARATRMLALGLGLAKQVCGVNIPADVLLRIDADTSIERMARKTLSQIFALSVAAVSTETNFYNLKIMDRKRDALASALRAFFVPTFTDWSAINLPPSLHPLYYAYRPLRLSKVYSTSLWRKLGSRGAV